MTTPKKDADAQRPGETTQDTQQANAGENQPTQGTRREKQERYPIRLLVDWWDEEGERRSRETEVEVPAGTAKKLVGDGKAVRADEWTTSRS